MLQPPPLRQTQQSSFALDGIELSLPGCILASQSTQFLQLLMPYATARWIDQNNRSHTWSGEVATRDRDQIKAEIRSQTGAKEVILQSVKA